MKTKIITLALSAASLGLVSTAKADNTRINVSFGVNTRPVYTAPAPVYVPAPVTTVVTAPAYGYSNYGSSNHGYSPARGGHWETVTNKVWVPERWVASRDRFGRPVRILERGFFTYRTERVWVENRHRGHGDERGSYSYNDGHGYRR
jgi:hypothetical protein